MTRLSRASRGSGTRNSNAIRVDGGMDMTVSSPPEKTALADLLDEAVVQELLSRLHPTSLPGLEPGTNCGLGYAISREGSGRNWAATWSEPSVHSSMIQV